MSGAEPDLPFLPAQGPPRLRLASASGELLWMGTVLASVGLVALAIGFAVVPVSRFSPLEATGSIVLFLLTTFAAVTGVTLGRRSGPEVMYWQKFERAPQPPPHGWLESRRRTAVRAVVAAIGLVLALAIGAAVGLAVTLLLIGKPRDEILIHLPGAAELIAAGWTLVCGFAALRIGTWFARWESRRRRRLLCRPLSAGVLAHVYYVAESARDR
ncbi:MAG TPA: hypothetical protein VKA96_03160 [Solirubrobacteraceae bacterium]|nr:hypothetical protein [Solirubrobacteraceae bacterium]